MITGRENITKIKELTDVLNNTSLNPNYEMVLRKLKMVIDSGKEDISNSKSAVSKVRCYENMCMTITAILKDVQY